MTSIALDMIERGDRLRGTSPEQVAALAESMAEVGLISPITVYPREIVRAGIAVKGFGLVAGLHRLEAAASLGWREIEAQVVTLPDLQRQLAECDENLCGSRLTPAERALFTRRRKEIYEALHPETRQGGVGRGGYEKGANLASFSADTAAKTGQSERKVQRDATRGERISDDVLNEIRGTDLDKGVVLDQLARAQDQAAELARIRENGRVKPAPSVLNEFETEEVWRAALIRVWNRGSQEWRERILPTLDAPVFDKTRAA